MNQLEQNLEKLSINNDINLIKSINDRINKEICKDTINKLSDSSLLNEYKKCKSVINKVNKLVMILRNEKINENKITAIINKYILDIIPSGTKGVIRGLKFNNIVKDFIINLKLDSSRFDIKFEANCPQHLTSEIPDWYIYDKETKKVIIGMNQLDLWNGGHQVNRGYKYLIDCEKIPNVKILCVICNEIIIKSDKNKTFQILKTGFENNTLCYLNNLQNIIHSTLQLKITEEVN